MVVALISRFGFGRVLAFPHVRQELRKFLGRRLADLGQDAGEVTLRIHAMPLCPFGQPQVDKFAEQTWSWH